MWWMYIVSMNKDNNKKNVVDFEVNQNPGQKVDILTGEIMDNPPQVKLIYDDSEYLWVDFSISVLFEILECLRVRSK